MTIAGEGKLDAHKLRADFPSSEQRFHGKPLTHLDSAVSAQKPRQVLDAQRELYETSYTTSTAASTYSPGDRTLGVRGAANNAPPDRDGSYSSPRGPRSCAWSHERRGLRAPGIKAR